MAGQETLKNGAIFARFNSFFKQKNGAHLIKFQNFPKNYFQLTEHPLSPKPFPKSSPYKRGKNFIIDFEIKQILIDWIFTINQRRLIENIIKGDCQYLYIIFPSYFTISRKGYTPNETSKTVF